MMNYAYSAADMLRYAQMLVRRGFVSNTLGAIALRGGTEGDARNLVYTKRKGVSLEEMNGCDVTCTDLGGAVMHGEKPSIGHQLNRAVLRERADVNAVIHVHVDEVIAFFSATGWRAFKFLSDDVPIVLGKPVYVLETDVNVEKDASRIPDFIQGTNCFVMPNHGVTTLGETLSQAYHRLTSFTAEVRRISQAILLANAYDAEFGYVPGEEVEAMFAESRKILYG